ncbi:zinc metalloproteinase nas-8 [Rhagoletis pomonella]|uniref:zinc metalloproteinase nas-8 n=1 Tax=Rhagoletis pomonella TaxID=28610 RepID=UPI001783B798|nr:zinc metalloproteinase nas-8 [Rhagoletis pomonella]
MLIFYAIVLLNFFVKLISGAPYQNSTVKVIAHKRDLIDLSRFGERLFGYPDVEAGEKLSKLNANSTENPEEVGPYLEGDLLVPHDKKLPFRNGLLAYSARWPGAIVPYEIHGSYTKKELAVIEHAFQEYHSKTCIRFKPRSYERDYIDITNDKSGCWASVGRLGGRQVVNLQAPLCFRQYGTSLHELMHAVGFMHEQNRPERDSYIRILSENIKPHMLENFAKGSARKQYDFGVPYDYASVMHYSKKSFSKNGQPTIEALKQTKEAQLMGQRIGFSVSDLAKLNAMYNCRIN